MDALFGAFAVIFILDVLSLFWPWPMYSATQVAIIAASALGWSLLVTDAGTKKNLLMALAISGLAWVLYHAYRLIRSWADRTEASNLLPLQRWKS